MGIEYGTVAYSYSSNTLPTKGISLSNPIKTTVLVAGPGQLGSRIASNLLEQPGVAVRLLARPGWEQDASKRARIEPLLRVGAEVVEGDVTDPASLRAATRGVDVVVSALQGGEDIIVAGQIALAAASVANGVRRFIPSDFAIDLFRAPDGPPQFEIRKRASAAIEQMDLEVLHILQGAFMDGILHPDNTGMIDLDSGVVRFWGSGDEPIDMTTVEDTARFTARVAIDPDAASGVHTISGARVTFNDLAREIEAVTGIAMTPVSWGDVDALRDVITAKGGGWPAMRDWYFVSMLTTPVFDKPANHRYPDVRPLSLSHYVASAYGERDALSGAEA